ncbi:hypothetical protein AVEN_154119-1 [Araneus ventricosus]|uniref:Uncharacterized protein n=1 Tax=Araneus ventricosus TaxID=182803 RepID=A0A4Y2C3N4_ARAVE|nr:hypothetical protein AVEN_154119-1 [Araneus ventricosus]
MVSETVFAEMLSRTAYGKRNGNLSATFFAFWDGDIGREIYNIMSSVSLRLTICIREDVILLNQHGPFLAYLKRFHLSRFHQCSCGGTGTALHYATKCALTVSWHMRKLAPNCEQEWLKRVANNLVSRQKIGYGNFNQKNCFECGERNGPYAPFGFESIEKQLWRNKQNDRPIRDSEIKAVLSQLFKTDQWLPPAGHVSEDVTSHA